MLPYCNINNTNKAIYINPNFRGQLPTLDASVILPSTSGIPTNAHINPLFLENHKPRNTIHMNPAFLKKFQEHQQLQLQQQQNEVPKVYVSTCTEAREKVTTVPVSVKNISTDAGKIICMSKNRLIREPLIKTDTSSIKLSKPSIPQPPLLVLNKRKLIRKVLPVSVVSRNKTESNSFDGTKVGVTKYKIDNRVIRKRSLLPPTPKIKRAAYVGRYALRRSSLSQSSNISVVKNTLAMNKNLNKKLQVLNINGLLYKSTKNSLKLKDMVRVRNSSDSPIKSSKILAAGQKSIANLVPKSNQGLSIFVRGTKYVMDANKFKLTRVTNNENGSTMLKTPNNNSSKAPMCHRIDIGGYTYISTNSAKNVLIRTTNHLSRAYVHNAKQKSLQLLTKRLVKTNIPCPIFQRIGKCAAYERGKCSKVHNKLQVAICGKFLRGECFKTNCLLSHNVSLSKMPVCKFFLQGVCVRNDCPYLHKKLSNETELCTDFLRGFCQLAEKCNKRHEFICPEIERTNICNSKNCIYCNAKRRKEEKKLEKESTNTTSSTTKDNCWSEVCEENLPSKRYFIDSSTESTEPSTETFPKTNFEKSRNDNDECLEENVEISRKRPKLGTLPAYIPL
ncbi:zinc finger CCCH domain-containing protein 3 [Cochliomyia hominivorax]